MTLSIGRIQPSGQRRIVHHLVTNDEKSALARGVRRYAGVVPAGLDGPPDSLALAAEALQGLLRRAAPELYRLLRQLGAGEVDAVCALNLPVAPDVSPLLALALGRAAGKLFQYKTQNGGDLLMQIAPQPGSPENSQTTAGEFRFHSDDALVRRDSRVETIGLLGQVNEAGARTAYASVADMRAFVSARTWAVLCEPRFSVRAPLSFNLGDDIWSSARPILSRTDTSAGFEIAWPSYASRTIDSDDAEGQSALAALEQAADASAFRVAVNPSVYFAFSNTRGVHAREPILGGDRLLLRTYSRADLTCLRERTGVIGPVFPTEPCLER